MWGGEVNIFHFQKTDVPDDIISLMWYNLWKRISVTFTNLFPKIIPLLSSFSKNNILQMMLSPAKCYFQGLVYIGCI